LNNNSRELTNSALKQLKQAHSEMSNKENMSPLLRFAGPALQFRNVNSQYHGFARDESQARASLRAALSCCDTKIPGHMNPRPHSRQPQIPEFLLALARSNRGIFENTGFSYQ
jgi:hypothetical protein